MSCENSLEGYKAARCEDGIKTGELCPVFRHPNTFYKGIQGLRVQIGESLYHFRAFAVARRRAEMGQP
jgi:hypothetical protein